jgi:hypothetical protein
VPRITAVRSPLARGLVALGAVAVLVVLFVVLAGGDDNGSDNTASTQTQTAGSTGTAGATGATGATGQKQSKPKPAIPRIEVVDGKPQGGVQRLTYTKGDPVRFAVTSDVADEIHVHGYDLKKDVPAGGTVRFSFPASIEGVFEVELEGRRQQIAELRVTPG